MPEIASLFASCSEQITPLEGTVKGVIPTWLEGKLMRIGPGLFDIEEGFAVNHFLDGFAMVSKFEIKNGKVWYSQKLIESESYQKAMIVKRPVYAEFSTHAYPDTTKGFLYRMFSTLVPTDLTDNNVAALYCIEDEVIAASETCFVHSLDCESLVKKERHDLMKSCGAMFSTSRPLTDSDRTTWNIGATMLTGCKYHLIKIPFISSGKASDALKESKIVATVPSSWKTCLSFMSSFGMTENYVIFMEQPLLINCVKLAQIGIKGKALRDTFEWTPSEKNRFIVIEKETGNVLRTKFMTDENFFVLHHINAFEKDDQIVVDLIGYSSPQVFDKYNLSSLRNNEFSSDNPSQTYRFVVPLIHYVVDVNEGENLVTLPDTSATAIKSGDSIILRPQKIGDPGIERPTINPRFAGRPYKFYYGSGLYGDGLFKNSVGKVNLESGTSTVYKTSGANEFCSEPTFIPKLDPTADEDDGLVLVPVSCNDTSKPDYLVILDSKTFEELGRVEYDLKFVQSLHSLFIWSYS